MDTVPLIARLRERIKREGPISFRDWMQAALYDERDGYYCRPGLARWGRAGDYRTSPERSPLFAATFAGYFATLYKELDAPRKWSIVEAGAGAGLFARGVLETLQRDYPQVFSATRYIIDEASPDACAQSRRQLAGFEERIEFSHLDQMKDSSVEGIIFSNELIDALPVRRVCMRGGNPRELYVGTDDSDAFLWIEHELTNSRLAAHLAHISPAEGQTAEVNLDAEDWITRAASVLRKGFVITVDYGAEEEELYQSPRYHAGTLRAVKAHRLTDEVLARPGEQDLTATVNWTQFRRAGERAGLHTVLFERQDKFLLHAGLLDQLERLTGQTSDEIESASLRLGAREMILPDGMSKSFQVLVQRK